MKPSDVILAGRFGMRVDGRAEDAGIVDRAWHFIPSLFALGGRRKEVLVLVPAEFVCEIHVGTGSTSRGNRSFKPVYLVYVATRCPTAPSPRSIGFLFSVSHGCLTTPIKNAFRFFHDSRGLPLYPRTVNAYRALTKGMYRRVITNQTRSLKNLKAADLDV